MPDFIGSPPSCRPECVISSECPSQLACINQHCRDPCPGSCGINAICHVLNHVPVCTCHEGHTGDPFSLCSPVQMGELWYYELHAKKKSSYRNHYFLSQNLQDQRIRAILLRVVRMQFATEMASANVCLSTRVIRTKVVVPNALSAASVREIKLVSDTSVRIRASVHADKKLTAMSSTTFQFARVRQIRLEILSRYADQNHTTYQNRLSNRVRHLHADQTVYVATMKVTLCALACPSTRVLLLHADPNVLSAKNVRPYKPV